MPDDKKKPPSKKGGPPDGGPPKDALGPGVQEGLMRPPAPMGPKHGQGLDPREAMMNGMGDISQFSPPPPPAPMAPMGGEGLPIGGGMPGDDPAMDPSMGGSSLFQALNLAMQQGGGQGGGMGGGMDPYASPPMGHGQIDPEPSLEDLLSLLAMMRAGGQAMGQEGQSGVMPEPTNPGLAQGLGMGLGQTM